ncbi:MAG: hypothetical protein V3T72_14355 [Thermoanaerobaculia bacterium]
MIELVRLLAYILAFSSVFTLLGTTVQLYWEYRTDVDDIGDILQQTPALPASTTARRPPSQL